MTGLLRSLSWLLVGIFLMILVSLMLGQRWCAASAAILLGGIFFPILLCRTGKRTLPASRGIGRPYMG